MNNNDLIKIAGLVSGTERLTDLAARNIGKGDGLMRRLSWHQMLGSGTGRDQARIFNQIGKRNELDSMIKSKRALNSGLDSLKVL